MTQRDLSTVILKLIGVSQIVGALVSMQTQSIFQYLNDSVNRYPANMNGEIFLSILLVVLVQLIAGILLIRFANKISALLFKESSEAVLTEKLYAEPLLEAGIILIALYVIFSQLPIFLPSFWYLIKDRIGEVTPPQSQFAANLIRSSLSIVIMGFIIWKNKSIVRLLDRYTAKTEQL